MIKNYFKTAWRNLFKNKVYTLLNLGGLATGTVVCLLIGVWLQRELSYDNFHPQDRSLFRLTNTFKSQSESFSQAPSGTAFGAQLPRLMPEIKAACRVFRFEYKFREENNQFLEPSTLVVDSNFFSFFGFRLIDGQISQVLNASDKVVLSEKTAIKYFGTTKNILGKTIQMDDQPMVVAGVAENAPLNSHLQYDIIIPYDNFRKKVLAQWKEDLDNEWVGGWPYVYVQLKDPSAWQATQTSINKLAAKYEEKPWKENNMSYQYFLQPVKDIHLKSNLRYDAPNNGSVSAVNIFTVVGIIVLLLACINYINLTTAGAMKRVKETSLRKVVGATKSQLLLQLFLETWMLSTFAVVIGVLIFKSILPLFSAWMGQPYFFPLTVTNLLCIAGFILLISLIAGIYPATFQSSFNPAESLKGNFIRGGYGNMIRKTLVVFQFTVSIALIASILIISQQMNFIKNKSLGFNGNAVVEVVFNGDKHVMEHYSSVKNELLKNPFILNVSKHSANVVDGLGNGWTTTQNSKGEEVSTSIYRLNVDADYFDTYGMKLDAGRFFSKKIPSDSTKAVLVNESAVKTFGWKTPEEAIGKPFGTGNDKKYVIGVIKDFNFESLHKPVDALLVGFVREFDANLISLKMDPAHLHEGIDILTKTWKDIVPQVPLEYFFIDQRLAEQYGNDQKMQGIFVGFSGLSLFIACLGLFGLSTFVVERKVKEIGIRKVLGASISGIVHLLSKDFLKLILLSVLIATPMAWYFMNGWLNDFAYRIRISPWIFLASGFIAIFIALLTISIQSIKAAMANPVKSLRTE